MMGLDALLSIGTDAAITLIAGATAFFAVLALWSGLVARDPMARRTRALLRHREDLRSGLLAGSRNASRLRRDTAVTFMSRIVARLNLFRGGQAAQIAMRLSRAGWRSRDSLAIFLFMKLTLPFTIGGLTLLMLPAVGGRGLPASVQVLIAALSVLVSAYLPDLYLRNAVQKRRHGLQKGLPDALDLLVICAEAGLGLDAAINRVADEIGQASPEIGDEFALTAVELGFLPDRRTALENLIRRTELAAIRAVVNTLLQAERYGTPLVQSLRVLSAEFRSERLLKAEEKAARLPATLTVPLVVFILPTLFVVLIGPAVLNAIDGLRGF